MHELHLMWWVEVIVPQTAWRKGFPSHRTPCYLVDLDGQGLQPVVTQESFRIGHYSHQALQMSTTVTLWYVDTHPTLIEHIAKLDDADTRHTHHIPQYRCVVQYVTTLPNRFCISYFEGRGLTTLGSRW